MSTDSIKPFIEATNWKERGLQQQKVKDICNMIIEELSLPEDDARIQGIIHVRQMCNTTSHIALALQHQAEANALLVSKILLLGDEKDIEGILKDFNSNSKGAFVTLTQFALENCIKAIIEAMDVPVPTSFYGAAKRIVEIADISNPEVKRHILLIPANIRNALHRNGIHTKASIPAIMLNGATYEFKQGERVKCGSWSYIFHILLHVLEIYYEILSSEAIRKIPHVNSE